MRSNSPRQGKDVNTIIGAVSILPCRIFVINNPLNPVHSRFIELLFNSSVFKRTRSRISSDSNIDKCSIRCCSIEFSLRTAGIKTGCSRHAHASGAVLISVIGVVGSIGLSSASCSTSWVGMKITYCVVTCNEFLIQTGMLVIDSSVDHGDVDTCTRDAEVPSTNRIQTRITSLDGEGLNISEEDDMAVFLNHHHIFKSGKGWSKRSIDLAQEYAVNRFDDINNVQSKLFKSIEMGFSYISGIHQTDASYPNHGFKRIVNFISVKVEIGSLPPWCILIHPLRGGLLRNFEGLAILNPLDSL